MKVLLLDIDSKIPNLALMKLSAWHKKRGDDVELNFQFGQYDKVYASCVFRKNKIKCLQLPYKDIEIGGVGYDLLKVLPKTVEGLGPDYDLYPDIDYSLGYTYRGCPRKCPFCIVPLLPKDNSHHSIYEFWNPGHQKLRLLNNNTFADPLWRETFQEIIKENLSLIEEGFDIRLLDEEKAHYLAKIKFVKQIHFAFDGIVDEQRVRRGIKILNGVGVKSRRLMFYVLCGFNTTLEEDKYRIDLLKSLGVDPFVMLYHKESKLLNEFARWNNRYYFGDLKFEDYLKHRRNSYLLKV